MNSIYQKIWNNISSRDMWIIGKFHIQNFFGDYYEYFLQ